MNKESFLCRLRAIVRQVTCMSDTEFNKCFETGTIKFDYFVWGQQDVKIHTTITMKKYTIFPKEPITLSEGIDPPAEQLPPPVPIDVSPEEYERLMKTFTWPTVHMSKEEIEKWWPKEGSPTPNWDALKKQIKGFIEKLKENGQ